ncbi:MAG: putative excinuclease subunit [Actinomycetota bacterium]
MADPSTYRPKTSEIPTDAGVYRYWDEFDRVIYVGKAKNLRNRLTSYFTDPANLHHRTWTMLNTAVRVDWVTVASEVEALQLEHSWIKEFDPRFNVRFRDDKSYPWLAISTSEKFPRVMVVRGERRKGWKYFGPYVQAWAIRDTIDRLLRVFPVRTCSENVFKRAKASGRPCLLGYIDKCSAPCVDKISEADHRELVSGFISLVEGDTSRIIKRLQSEMSIASDELEFERAARLRDDIAAVESVAQKSAVVLSPDADVDVIAIHDDELAAGVQIFHVRSGRVRGERGFVTDKTEDTDASGIMVRVLQQMYSADGGETPPREIVVSHDPQDVEVVSQWLSQRRGSAVDIRVPQRGSKKLLMETVVRNAEQSLASYRAKRGADIASRGHALEEIAEYLDLKQAPLRIECIDVSHLDGTDVVASLVVFEDGLPLKSDYRRFVIKHGQGNDDVRSIAEVVTRRFKHVEPDVAEGQSAPRKRFAYPPQLLVVDGGKPQINAAAEALAMIGVDIAVVGLAKRLEELWLPDSSDPVIMPRTSEGLFLLQRIRDEAHRFAIGHQRNRARKSLMDSILDDISGLGPARKKSLIKHFGSVKKLRAATVEEIAEIPGVGAQLAESIHGQLAAMESTPALNTATGEIIEGS